MRPRLIALALLIPHAAPALAGGMALDLPAGRLGDAVLQLGRASGTSIAVESPALWQRRVPAIRGRMGVRQALARLAAAAGAEVRTAGPAAWRLVARTPPKRTPGAIAPPPTLLAAPPPAAADIVVTASKRDVPLSRFAGQATVIDGADLAFGGAGGTDSILARLASVSSTYLGAGRNKLFIRGIADSSFTGPTQATVGQYWGDLRLSYNAPDPDLRLYDMASVEVLEGPQGTLYGAGSLGGIIRVSPNAPIAGETSAAVTAGGSLTAHGDPGGDLSAMLNLPLAGDTTALRLVGYGVSDGGYIDNPLLGRRDINRTRIAGGRGALRLQVDGWTIDLSAIGQVVDGADSQYADRGGPRLSRASAIDQGFAASYLLGQIVIGKDWGALRFRSSTGLIRQRLHESYDATVPAGMVLPGSGVVATLAADSRSAGEARAFRQRNATHLFATENRLWRPMADGFGWVIGASFTANATRLERSIGLVGAPQPVTGVTNRIREATLYGEASATPLRGLTVTAGARLSRARLAGGGEDVAAAAAPQIVLDRQRATADRTTTSLLPSASVSAAVLPRLSLYARYQQGFRPGGLAIEGDFVRRFRGDRVQTLESGLRFGQPGRDPVDLSVSVSFTDWSDIQADFIDGSGLPSTANIGDGRVWTLNAAGGWRPIEGLRLDFAASLNDSAVSEPSPALSVALARMSRVPNVARFAGRIGVDYRRPIGDTLALRLNGWARYVGRSRLGIGPVLGEAQGDYLDTALTVRIGTPRLGLTIGATNLTDAVGNRFALGTPFATGRPQITPMRPRTLRIALDAGF